MKKSTAIISVSVYFLLLISACHSHSPNTANEMITDSAALAAGELSFAQNCSGCHNFRQDGIGPQLGSSDSQVSGPWFRQFVRDPQKMISSGDRHANELFRKYKIVMPSFGNLTDDQLNSLLAFLRASHGPAQEKGKQIAGALPNPIPEAIPVSGLVVGLNFFAQFPASGTNDKPPLARITKMGLQPGSNDLFIVDLRGKLYRLPHNKHMPEVYLNLASGKSNFIQEPGIATGFGSFAFHPDFLRNGFLYTTHTEKAGSGKADFALPDSIKPALQWVLTEWKSSNPKARVFSGVGRELLRIDMVWGSHGVQEISFNPLSKPGDKDYGLLYIGIGDGGSAEAGFPFLIQSKEKIWGTVIRVNPLGRNSSNGQYGIPADNPFTKDSNSNVRQEIYAYGFRNPHRITWTQSGKMLVSNVGQGNIESIDEVAPGNNFGWPEREGNFMLYKYGDLNKVYPLPAQDSLYHYTYPIAEFDHDEGKAISGGYEYQGKDIPALKGKFLFGDISSGRLFYINVADIKKGKQAPIREWKVSVNGKTETLKQLCGYDRVEPRFGRDADGEIYILTKVDGKLYKLTNGQSENKLITRLPKNSR